MGTLIIGGLLVIALLAIVGSIFAARGGTPNNARRVPAAVATPKVATPEDDRTSVGTPEGDTASSEGTRVEAPPVETPSPQPPEPIGQLLPPGVEVPSQPVESVEQSLSPAAEPIHNGQAHEEQIAPPVTGRQIVPTPPEAGRQPSYNANGQVHELTAQLQALHEEAQHLSERLSILTEMAEHIEGRQSTRWEDGV